MRWVARIFYRVAIKRDDNDLVLVCEPRWRWLPSLPQADVRIPFDALTPYG